MNKLIRRQFNLEKDVVLNPLPIDDVRIVIPQQFINKNTGGIYVDKYIQWLAYGDCNMTLEYEIKRR